jgi:hypothetical protein
MMFTGLQEALSNTAGRKPLLQLSFALNGCNVLKMF